MSETKTPKSRTKRGGTKSYTCAGCGNSFEAFRSNRVYSNSFCSHACANAARAARMKAKRITRPCGYCGTEISKPVSRDTGKQFFCNREHYLAWRHAKK